METVLTRLTLWHKLALFELIREKHVAPMCGELCCKDGAHGNRLALSSLSAFCVDHHDGAIHRTPTKLEEVYTTLRT